MAVSSREWVRRAVGLAALAPAAGLLVLAVILAVDGGVAGLLAAVVVASIALLLVGFAFAMTYAPVTIHKLLRRSDKSGESSGRGSDGQEPDQAASPGDPPGRSGKGLKR